MSDLARAITMGKPDPPPNRFCDVIGVASGVATVDYSGVQIDIPSTSWYCWRDPVAGDVVWIVVNGSDRFIAGIRR